MNKEIVEIIQKRNLHPIAYKKNKSVYIVECNDYKYVIKLHTNNYDIYKYLTSRNFLFFPKNFNLKDENYDISLFINGIVTNKEQKLNDYIKLIAILHNKTLYMREIDLDEIKDKYEKISNQIKSLRDYYYNLNESLNHELFLSPGSYLLLRNISLIYRILDNDEILLNEVYNKIKIEKSIRISLLHNNQDLDHLIISNEKYLISWDKAYFDSPIVEIKDLYRKYYHDISLSDLLKIYESINPLTSEEKKVLLIYLSIPKELSLTNNTYLDTKKINNEINYLNKVFELLIQYKN